MIFCVEDDNSIRELMLYTLQASGFAARGFEDGAALFAALEEGVFEQKMPQNLYEIAKKAVENLQLAAENAQISLTLEGKSAQIFGVEPLLYSVVYNLCDNAIKYNHQGGRVTVQVREGEEQVIDCLRETLRNRHILRLQLGECLIDAGFVWSDLLTNLERTADHCSNIAGTVLEMSSMRLDLHDSQRHWRHDNEDFKQKRDEYTKKYALAKE